MRARDLVAAIAVVAISCSGAPSPAANAVSPSPSDLPKPSPSPIVSATAEPSPTPPPLPGPDSPYGLILTGNVLEMIDIYGVSRAHASVAKSSVGACAEGMDVVLQPPVSAGLHNVFFRDGDTQIRFLSPSGTTGDVTTVPGGPLKVSFFSVSPDETRIAVLVEDLAPIATINLQLYVEDLHGAGHRVELYKSSTPKKAGKTLWPMGWRRGNLVLAQMTPCRWADASGTNILPANLAPTEWHVSSATTGDRLATIRRAGCTLSFWPSPAGVACVDPYGSMAYQYDWGGGAVRVLIHLRVGIQSSISPHGSTIVFSHKLGVGPLPSFPLNHGAGEASQLASVRYNGAWGVTSDTQCLWIDETHTIGPQSVLEASPVAKSTALAGAQNPSGVCAGRFPGGL